jgi:hypothetical protein
VSNTALAGGTAALMQLMGAIHANRHEERLEFDLSVPEEEVADVTRR